MVKKMKSRHLKTIIHMKPIYPKQAKYLRDLIKTANEKGEYQVLTVSAFCSDISIHLNVEGRKIVLWRK